MTSAASGGTVLTEVSSVAVLVHDGKKAAAWYQEKLGFELESMHGHWVAVRPKGSNIVLHLCERCEEWGDDRPGGQTGIGFKSDDKEKTYRELKEKSVPFAKDLRTEWFGTFAIFKDIDGNEFWM